jgi:hypothetical protein
MAHQSFRFNCALCREGSTSMSTIVLKSSSRIAALLAAVAVFLAACGGGGVTPTPASGGGGSGGGGSGGGGSGGGGTTASATPYILFASNYVAYNAQTNGAYLHSIQLGDLYAGFGGNYGYGCYSASQPDMDRTQLYIVQAQANGDGNCNQTSSTPPTAAGDYVYVAIKAPASNGASVTSIPPIDISQSTTLLVQMGNTVNPDATHGHANVFTVVLTNDPQGNGSAATATATCSYDQTLVTVGASGPSALGVNNYAIPLSAFTCSPGTMSTLQTSGVTSVAVKFTGDKNPSVVAGEYNTIAVGYIGFSK